MPGGETPVLPVEFGEDFVQTAFFSGPRSWEFMGTSRMKLDESNII